MSLLPQEQLLLKQGSLLSEMTETLGWRDVIKPYLESYIANTWVDPRTMDEKELVWKYNQAFLYSRAFKDLLEFIDKKIKEGQGLEQKAKGEVSDPFKEALGG